MPPLRILPALLLLSLAAAVLPCCNATVRNSNSAVTQVEADATDTETTLVGCHPGIFLYNSDIKYQCVVEDASMAKDWEVYTAHFLDTIHKGGWPTTVDVKRNTVSFVAGNGTYSGTMAFSMQRKKNGQAIPFVAKRDMKFIQPEETKSTFTAAHPYYGMEMELSTNLPSEFAGVVHVLLPFWGKCQDIEKICKLNVNCHIVGNDSQLPPPGRYRLCVTANGWKKRYLPWGQSSIDVAALVSMPLTLSNGVVPSITLYNADTREVAVLGGVDMYPVRCLFGGCYSLHSQGGDTTVDADMCKFLSGRVYLKNTSLYAVPGKYVLCIAGIDGYASPAAVPVNVVEKPFAMEAGHVFDDSVRVNVSGRNDGKR